MRLNFENRNQLIGFVGSIIATPFVWAFVVSGIMEATNDINASPTGYTVLWALGITVALWVGFWVFMRKHNRFSSFSSEKLLLGAGIIIFGFFLFAQVLWGAGWQRTLDQQVFHSTATYAPVSNKVDNQYFANPAISNSPLLPPVLIQQGSTATDNDPIVNCEYPHSGTLPVKKSECAGTKVDCEIESGKWQVVWKADCDALRAKEAREIAVNQEKETVSTIECKLSYGTYNLTETDCAKYKSTDTSYKAPTYSPLPWPTLKPLKIDCYVGGGVIPNLTVEDCTERLKQYNEDQQYIADLEQQHEEACGRAYADWQTIKQQFYATEANNYSSSAEAIKALAVIMQEYQAEMISAGCTQKLYL